MNAERLFSWKNPWCVRAVVGVTVIFVLSAIVGFIWMPYVQGDKTIAGIWDAICRAAGAPGGRVATEMSSGKVASSDVIVIPEMISGDQSSIGRGGTLALRCTMCHGARGMSEAHTPNLAGQNAEGLYKQLRDLQSGHRVSEIMSPHARNLSDQDMRDLSAYYAYLPRFKPPPSLVEQLMAPRIVQIGSPMRNIAPCASCHGGSDVKSGTPYLEGQPESYVRSQLKSFAEGRRKNDISGQMRIIAKQMTPEEVEEVAKYYSRR